MMNVNQAIETFGKYSLQGKIDFLVHFAHTLTILARDTYAIGEDGPSRPSRLRTINEIQHRLMSFLIALRQDEARRYPDDVLVRIMLEHPEDGELQRQLREAFDHLMGKMAATT
jgi:hypothetical protein